MFSDNGVRYCYGAMYFCFEMKKVPLEMPLESINPSSILRVLFKSREKYPPEKNSNCNPHFNNWVHIWAIFILKWVKILVIAMGFRNAFDPFPKNGIH